MKICTVCKQTKSLQEFYNRADSKDGVGSRCKPCDSLANKKWAKANPIQKRRSQRERNWLFRYGITVNDYIALLKTQGGLCAICGVDNNGRFEYFAVDHCHTTAKVRGLLCNRCNRGLGLLHDSTEILSKAKKYLETH